MSVPSRPEFHDEATAFEHIEGILWPQGPVCHHCGSMERAYRLKGVHTKPSKMHPNGLERHGLYKCGECRKQFTVRMGSIFEGKPPAAAQVVASHPPYVRLEEGRQRPPDAPRARMHL